MVVVVITSSRVNQGTEKSARVYELKVRPPPFEQSLYEWELVIFLISYMPLTQLCATFRSDFLRYHSKNLDYKMQARPLRPGHKNIVLVANMVTLTQSNRYRRVLWLSLSRRIHSFIFSPNSNPRRFTTCVELIQPSLSLNQNLGIAPADFRIAYEK